MQGSGHPAQEDRSTSRVASSAQWTSRRRGDGRPRRRVELVPDGVEDGGAVGGAHCIGQRRTDPPDEVTQRTEDARGRQVVAPPDEDAPATGNDPRQLATRLDLPIPASPETRTTDPTPAGGLPRHIAGRTASSASRSSRVVSHLAEVVRASPRRASGWSSRRSPRLPARPRYAAPPISVAGADAPPHPTTLTGRAGVPGIPARQRGIPKGRPR